MRSPRLSAPRILFNIISLSSCLLVPTLSHSQALTPVQSGTRYAGTITSGFNGDLGPAATVSLNTPSYLVFDSHGNQYLSDTQNNCVRKIDASGSISTLAGLAVSGQGDTCSASNGTPTPSQGLFQPTGLAIDSSNNLYIADSKHNCVRMLANGSAGTAALTTVAGSCGSATSTSTTPNPNGLVLDASNNLYISLQDTETLPTVSTYQVLRRASDSSLCVVAGTPSTLVPNTCSGITGSVVLSSPSGLAISAVGDLFIADTGNNCVRQVVNLATFKTAVGKCSNDSSGNPATALNKPYGLVFSPGQSLFITETGPDNVVRYALESSSLTIAAGLPNGAAGSYNSTQDGKSALSAPLNEPRGIAFDSIGNFLLADSGNSIVRKFSSNLIFPVTPVGSQSPTEPLTFIVNQSVNLSVTSSTDFAITSNTCSGTLSPAGAGAVPNTCQVFVRFAPTRPGLRSASIKLTDSISGKTVLQGVQAVGTGSLSTFTPGIVNTVANSLASPVAVAVDSAGNAYVLEDGNASGTADLLLLPAGGGAPQTVVPPSPGLVTPSALAIDSTGNFFIADAAQGTISRFGADGTINTSYITGLDTPTAICVDGFDNLFIAQAGNAHNVIEFYTGGSRRIVSTAFVSPSSLFLDFNGILYIADTGGHLVYAVDKTGALHVVAGNGTTSTTVQGQATGTGLIAPSSLSIDAAGNLYIADTAANRVYVVYSSTTSGGNNISTIFGTGAPGKAGDGGFSNLAQVNKPVGVAVDGSGNLFVIDNGNNSTREITYPTPTLSFGTIAVGQSSPVVQQSLSNFGTDTLSLTLPFSISDSHFTIDSNSTTCGTSIIPGSTCNLGFVFTPTTDGGVTANVALNSNSYNSPQSLQLTATGKHLALLQFTLSPQTEVFGQPFPETLLVAGGSPAPTGTVTFSIGQQILCTLNSTLDPTTLCNAQNSGLSIGSYPVTFSYAGDSNYAPASGTVNLTVNPAPLTITVDSTSRPYGGSNPTFTGTLTGVAPGDTILVSYASSGALLSPVGNYPIFANLTTVGSTNLSNYTLTNNPGTLTITSVAFTVKAFNVTRQYGEANPMLGGTMSPTINGDTVFVTYATTATITSPIGTYPITATVTGSAMNNYAVTVIPGVLTITQNLSLLINVDNAARPYGVPNPNFTGTVSGVIPGDNVIVTFATAATQTSSAGRYAIGANVSGTSAGNYIATIHPGTLDVSPIATITTLATSASPATVGANVTFTATVASTAGVVSGTVNFSDGSTLLGTGMLNSNGVATFSTTALSLGSHSITAVFQANTNFTASSSTITQIMAAPAGSFTLTASPATQSIKGAGATVYQVAVTSVGGFVGQINLACSGLPSDATCTFANNPTLAAGGTASVAMTVNTTVADAMLRKPNAQNSSPVDLMPITAAAVFPIELTGVGFLFAGLRRRKELNAQKMRLLVAVIFSLGILGLAGCGGGPTSTSTVSQTYTINITATSTGSTASPQSTTVSLSVGA